MNKLLPLYFFLILVTLMFAFDLAAKQSVQLHKDIPIGANDGTKLSINIALPNTARKTPRPVILMVHGGGFISGDKDSKNAQIQKFAQRGFVSASAMYRFAPEFKFPSQIEDIKLAIRFLKANAAQYNLDPERIIVSGSSAGSYLAVMIGVTGNSDAFSKHGQYQEQSSSVRAVAAQSAPIADFTLSKYGDSLTSTRLAGHTQPNIEQVLQAMSPKTYLDSNDPPFFLSHGDSDPIIPVDMSREFVSELEEVKHQYEYYEVKNGTHSFKKSAPKQAKLVFSRYLAFINKWSQ